MSAKQVHTLDLPGTESEVKFEHIRALAKDAARFDVWTDDGRKWRVDVLEDDVQVVAAWRDEELANLETPDWLEAFGARVRNS